MRKKLLMCFLVTLLAITLVPLPTARGSPLVGFSDRGILVKEWSFDMHWYPWGWFGSSPAIANLGPDVNKVGTEPVSDLEIVTGSDELWGPDPLSRGVWRAFDSGGNLEWQRGTQTDEARSSPAIIDINGDGNLEIAGGTTSGWYVQVMDRQGNFIWTFPKLTGTYLSGPFVWPSSPAVADLNPKVSGLEVVIGNRWLGNVWCFDGDNSDGSNDGITIAYSDYPWYDGLGNPLPLGTEGIDWDVLWKFNTGGSVVASPAIGDVDNDGALEVVIGSTDDKVYILDGATGSLEHSFSTGDDVYASAALANLDGDAYLEIVVGSTDDKVYCLQWTGLAGTTEWTYTTGGDVYSSAAIGDIDGDGALEIVVGSNDGKVYALAASGSLEWNYTTGGAVYSSPALAERKVKEYAIEWQMFRHDARRTGFYGPSHGGLDIYVGSDDGYLYLLNGDAGSMIDRFEVYKAFNSFLGSVCGIHTSPSVADVDGDKDLEIFFYDWGQGSTYNGHTFWCVERTSKARATGGGWIAGSKQTFSFTVMIKPSGLKGELRYVDHGTGMTVHIVSISSLHFLRTTTGVNATFSGACQVNGAAGYAFRVQVGDNGEPGKGVDSFLIDINDPAGTPYYYASDLLEGGNIQVYGP